VRSEAANAATWAPGLCTIATCQGGYFVDGSGTGNICARCQANFYVATSWSPTTPCAVTGCISGYSLSGSGAAATCTECTNKAGASTFTANTCTITACNAGYTLTANACVSNGGPAPTPTTTTSTDGCFPGSATVLRSDGATVRLDELATGESVLTLGADGTPAFSPVFTWAHYDRRSVHPYVGVTAASGARMQLLRVHYLHVARGGCGAAGAAATVADTAFLLTAEELRIGDGVWVLSDDAANNATSFVCSPVVSLDLSPAVGLYGPFTLTGSIVVNDMLASVMVSYELLPELLIGPRARDWYRAAPVLRVGALRPPMWYLHFALFKGAYVAFGDAGLRVVDLLNAPLYRSLGIVQSTNAYVAAELAAARAGTNNADDAKPSRALPASEPCAAEGDCGFWGGAVQAVALAAACSV
jgi:hypothetical protein